MAKIFRLDASRKPQPKRSDRPPSCDHKKVVAYTAWRTVRCAVCGTELDSFDVLVDMIKGYPPRGGGKDEEKRFDREAERRRKEGEED